MVKAEKKHILLRFYESLFTCYGRQHWWPADSDNEVVIGAILTQNTSWSNVEKAIGSMREHECMEFSELNRIDVDELAEVIRSAGTFRIKARRLKAFVSWLFERYDGDLEPALSGNLKDRRRELLSISGIGPETADAILLYAGRRLTFVVDAYTHRVLRRHGLIEGCASYDQVKNLFESNLPGDVQMYNEYHALLVEVGKKHCKTKADCSECPLRHWSHDESL